jgi:pilus assembly protein CpaB
MKNYVLLGVAIVAGFLAFVLHLSNIKQKYKELGLQADRIAVLVAKQNLAPGDVIKDRSYLSQRRILKSNYTEQQIRVTDEVDLIVGQKVANVINRGDFIMWRDIDMPRGGAGSALANRIQKQERAVSVAVDHIASVSTLVRPNDHIDVLGTFRFPAATESNPGLDTVTLTILQNVTVLAVGQELAGGSSSGSTRSRGYNAVTLNVSPQEAELLVFAQQKGNITLTLRNPRDVYAVKDPPRVNFEFLEEQLKDITDKRASKMKSP